VAPSAGPGPRPPSRRSGRPHRHEISAEAHVICPGHVAWVEQDWVNVTADVQVCTDANLAAQRHPRPGTTSAANDSGGDAVGESEEQAAAAFIARAVVTGDHAVRRAFEQTHPLAVDLFGLDGASRANSADGGDENRITYPGYTRRADLATLDGVSERRLTLVTLAIVLAAYEAAPDRHAWRQDGGCTEKHHLKYLDSLGYQLCDVARLAAGLEPLDQED